MSVGDPALRGAVFSCSWVDGDYLPCVSVLKARVLHYLTGSNAKNNNNIYTPKKAEGVTPIVTLGIMDNNCVDREANGDLHHTCTQKKDR